MKKWNIGNLWKKYKYVGLVVLAGILLMLLPGKKTDAGPQEGGGSFSLEDTERRMEELLGPGMCHILHIRPQGGCVVLK